MADLLDFGGVRVFTSNAAPGAGYVARFFVSGTTTPKVVYTDSTLGTPHGSSVTADAAGRFEAVWSSGDATKCVIEDADGAVIQTIDPVISVAASTSAAENISFTPTVDLPYTNVQDAIEGAAASAASGFSAYGIGITGSAELLANLDATNIGAGAYRFDGTTTGTFPTGVAASDTGLIEHWRQASGTAMQALYHATSDRVFHRRMASSAWGTWRENIEVNQGAAEGDVIYRGASAWTRLAKGTAGQLLRMNSGATAPEWGSPPGWTWLSAISTPSGSTPADFAIPSTASEICLLFKGTDRGTAGDDFLVRLGTASAFESSGYSHFSGIPASTGTALASAFAVQVGAAGAARGEMNLKHLGSNEWSQTHTVAHTTTRIAVGSGTKTLADVITRIRVLPSSGNWAGGSVQAGYR